MRKGPLPEILLALFAGRTRAAAIYGDLLELTETQPRSMLRTSYLTTLFSLTWRPLTAALIAGSIFAVLCDRLVFPTLFFLAFFSPPGKLLAYATVSLWFLVPFALIRYGFGDRVLRLASAAAIVSTGIIFAGQWMTAHGFTICIALASIVAIGIAMSRPMRRPSLVMWMSVAAGIAMLEALDHIGSLPALVGLPIDVLVLSIVFSWLHRTLRPSQLTGATHA